MIKLEHVCKNFGDLEVLKDVNLEVKEGEKLVIIGPSGSGKSTTVLVSPKLLQGLLISLELIRFFEARGKTDEEGI